MQPAYLRATIFFADFFPSVNVQKFKALGTDVLRVWAASSNYTGDLAVGPMGMEQAAARLQRFRLLLKFMLGNLQHGTADISSFSRDDMSLVSRSELGLNNPSSVS